MSEITSTPKTRKPVNPFSLNLPFQPNRVCAQIGTGLDLEGMVPISTSPDGSSCHFPELAFPMKHDSNVSHF